MPFETEIPYNILQKNICEDLFNQKMDFHDVVFINVAYDKELKPIILNGWPLGTTPITDREKLFKLLKAFNQEQCYKYIILDITFDNNIKTNYDDSLYNLMREMPRITFAKDSNQQIPRDYLNEKAAYAHYYRSFFSNNFVRYEYTLNDTCYIPTKVFQDINPNKKINGYGWRFFSIYTCDGNLVQNSCFLKFDSNKLLFNPKHITNDSIPTYRNLGFDYVDDLSDIEDKGMTNTELLNGINNKYIIIGDFVDDMHETYMGDKQGSLIIYHALKSLEEGKNIVSLSYILYWGVIFFFITLYLIKGNPLLSYIPLRFIQKNKLILFFSDQISIGVLIWMFSLLEYVLLGTVHSVFAPTFYFLIFGIFIRYKKYQVS